LIRHNVPGGVVMVYFNDNVINKKNTIISFLASHDIPYQEVNLNEEPFYKSRLFQLWDNAEVPQLEYGGKIFKYDSGTISRIIKDFT